MTKRPDKCPKCGSTLFDYEKPWGGEPEVNIPAWHGGWCCAECDWYAEDEPSEPDDDAPPDGED